MDTDPFYIMPHFELNLDLHENQRKIFDSPSRFKIVCSGRRFGKTRLDVVWGLCQSLMYKGDMSTLSPPVVLMCAPLLKQARHLLFTPLVSLVESCPDVFKINRSDFRIEVKDRPDILIRGFNDGGDSLRGLRIAALVCDEVQDFKSLADFDASLMPALSDTKGSKMICTGTPKGKVNILHDLYDRCQNYEEYEFFQQVTADNPFVSRAEIERARSTLPARLFRQEFEANFEDFEGALFSEFQEKHMQKMGPDCAGEVQYVGVDPGVTNPAIVYFTLDNDKIFKVRESWYDNEGNTHTTLDILNKVRSICPNPHRIFIPDDRADYVKEFRASGLKQAVLVKRGQPGPLVRSQILNALFKCDRLFVNESEVEFKNEIVSYHRDSVDGKIVDKVAPRQSDHRIDALAYGIGRLCMGRRDLLPHEILVQG